MDKSISMILANRTLLKKQSYTINGIKLQSLDYLREYYVDNLKNVICYNDTWDSKKYTVRFNSKTFR